MNQSPSSSTTDVARSFYQELASQGFSAGQVVGLATDLLDLVHGELSHRPALPSSAEAGPGAASSSPGLAVERAATPPGAGAGAPRSEGPGSANPA